MRLVSVNCIATGADIFCNIKWKLVDQSTLYFTKLITW